MRATTTFAGNHRHRPRACAQAWWIAVLVLCSCRAIPRENIATPLDPEPSPEHRSAVSDSKRAIEQVANVPIECVADEGLPIPITTASPWAPPGIAGPWPHDEYLLDGGDRDVQVNLGSQGELRGLELEDTVVVCDNTVDGRTLIEPSNRVCLYSPRFAAVRKVTSVLQSEQREQLVGVRLPIKPQLHLEDLAVTTAVQPIQPEGEIGTKQASISRVGESAVPATSRLPIMALGGGFAPHENFKALRLGLFDNSEKAQLIEMVDAAIVWSHEKAVQVVLDGRAAVSVTSDQRVQSTYRVDVPNNPCLRVIKVASTKIAKPGEIVDFTIRFDNLGDTALEHVVLMDNLTTRLEYVPGSAESSRDAEFTTETNEGDSLVLRWDFSEPLPVGQGGLVRFHCRVR